MIDELTNLRAVDRVHGDSSASVAVRFFRLLVARIEEPSHRNLDVSIGVADGRLAPLLGGFTERHVGVRVAATDSSNQVKLAFQHWTGTASEQVAVKGHSFVKSQPSVQRF
ncbi:hypothetical protein Poly59_29730 [Rubripirellula reticaptiva]|uniref:Uncharacterized protein n=1 Tax=Rubripirellula reticaptiva TaxID=2528013 RepID=A0A5C6EVY4_9BACT|nr:hypothetical protein Poly59_29730 [Rubripirellula reticaptiva]